MAGKIIADTLETGAGADIATSYVVNGSAKAWINLNGTGTIATRDSLNISGTTDTATGKYSASFSTSMGSINYTAVGSVGGDNDYFCFSASGTTRGTYNITSASSIPINSSRISDNAEVDNATIFVQVDGDLA